MRIAVAQILAIVAIAGEFAAPAIAQSATEPGTQAATQSDAQTAAQTGTQSAAQPAVAGSSSCIECHARFYELWSTSHHGTAMQPYTPDFARKNLPAQTEPLRIGDRTYHYQSDKTGGWVTETNRKQSNRYPIQHVMGGKNVYYLLTPLSRGRLQVLPIAYDVRKRQWLDTTASAVRHFAEAPDEALDWRARELTFNTSCYGCHVSQLSTNFDLESDTYNTTWREPGINCETCHGSAVEHVRVCRAAPPGQPPTDLRILDTNTLTPARRDDMCVVCHAKLMPLSADFKPGERYFDHFDLRCLEDRDFHPDGRDLGENYTLTQWRMNPCVKSGALECLHCHTSSGRYRFATENPDGACLPCHAQRVAQIAEHSHHPPETGVNTCIACHMPKTDFARMQRSDHSLRPPMPAATIAHDSPNACNLCHTDQTPEWANEWVQKWYPDDYQQPTLEIAALVNAARRGDWSRLDEIGDYLARANRDEVFATSLVRLLQDCPLDAKWPILIRATRDPSPLVRSSAALGLTGCPLPDSLAALVNMAEDPIRVVRIRAAAALAGLEPQLRNTPNAERIARALAEFEAAMNTRQDDPGAHINLGNFHMDRGMVPQAISAFETAQRVDPPNVPARVNAALAYNLLGQNDKAEAALRQAISIEPRSPAAWLNLGLLLGEQDRRDEAVNALKKVLELDPHSAVAAYNLGILLSQQDLAEAVRLCRIAAQAAPHDPRYAYTLAYFIAQQGDVPAAIEELRKLTAAQPAYAPAFALLGGLLDQQGRPAEAYIVYQSAANNPQLTDADRRHFAQMAESRQPPGE